MIPHRMYEAEVISAICAKCARVGDIVLVRVPIEETRGCLHLPEIIETVLWTYT